MRIGTALAAFATAVSTMTAQAQSNCPSGEIVKLSSIAKAGSPYQQCAAATKFTIIPIIGEPTEAQWKAICATPSCSTAAAEIRALTSLGDCRIVNTVTLKSFNVFRYGRDYDILCASYTSAPSPAPTTSSPTPNTQASTLAPVTSAPAPISQSSTPPPIAEAPTPIPNSQTPTPTASTGAPSPAPTSQAPTPASVTFAPTPITSEPRLPKPTC